MTKWQILTKDCHGREEKNPKCTFLSFLFWYKCLKTKPRRAATDPFWKFLNIFIFIQINILFEENKLLHKWKCNTTDKCTGENRHSVTLEKSGSINVFFQNQCCSTIEPQPLTFPLHPDGSWVFLPPPLSCEYLSSRTKGIQRYDDGI